MSTISDNDNSKVSKEPAGADLIVESRPEESTDTLPSLGAKNQGEENGKNGGDVKDDKKKTRGRPKLTDEQKKQRKKDRDKNKSTSKVGTVEKEKDRLSYTELGDYTAGLFFGACRNIEPEEWKPNESEEKGVSKSFARYYESEDMTDLPPWLAILITTGGYVSARVAKPKTRTKMQKIKDWFKGKKVDKKAGEQ